MGVGKVRSRYVVSAASVADVGGACPEGRRMVACVLKGCWPVAVCGGAVPGRGLKTVAQMADRYLAGLTRLPPLAAAAGPVGGCGVPWAEVSSGGAVAGAVAGWWRRWFEHRDLETAACGLAGRPSARARGPGDGSASWGVAQGADRGADLWRSSGSLSGVG